MSSETSINRNWSSDLRITDEKKNNPTSDFIKSTVEREIQRWKKESDSDTDVSTMDQEKILNLGFPDHLNKNLFVSSERNNYFKAYQKWIGYIVEVYEDTFKVRLKDLTQGGTDEETILDKAEVSPEDKILISEGNSFYWSIGKEMDNGQIKKQSIIRFKRSAPWSEEDFDRATDRANSYYEDINWD